MMGWVILALIIGGLFGYANGWVSAHRTVATECERLGSFFVGKEVFRCVAIEEKPHD